MAFITVIFLSTKATFNNTGREKSLQTCKNQGASCRNPFVIKQIMKGYK